MTKGLPQLVSFESRGFRDVYWCPSLNEPYIITYKLGTQFPVCSGCNNVYESIERMENDFHTFICSIYKPGGGHDRA